MGLEKRKTSSNPYYYRKRRKGGKVVSEYVGKDNIAEFAAYRQEVEAKYETEKREKRDMMIAEQEEIIAPVVELDQLTKALIKATLLVNGYHSHKGQWRRKRDNTGG